MKKKSIVYLLLISILIIQGCLKDQDGKIEAEYQIIDTTEDSTLNGKETTGKTSTGIELILYFANKEVNYLSPETRKIPTSDNVFFDVLKELAKGPEKSELIPTIPEGIEILGVTVEGKTAKVNFSSEIIDKYPVGSSGENYFIFSIVNTLTEFSDIEKVKFLVEGKSLDIPGSNYDIINDEFLRSEDLILKNKQ